MKSNRSSLKFKLAQIACFQVELFDMQHKFQKLWGRLPAKSVKIAFQLPLAFLDEFWVLAAEDLFAGESFASNFLL